MFRLLKIVWKLFLLFLALLVVLALSGTLWQYFRTSEDMKKFPPPGKVVKAGKYRLHYTVSGSGTPTVVFDAPVGASSLGWMTIRPDVDKFASTLCFDRPGYGWSDPAADAQTSGKMVEALHDLLERESVPKPYLFVGASLGGLNARLYAFRYPADVAGMILVDPAHEEQFTRSPSSEDLPVGVLRLFQFASRIGLLRALGMPVDVAGMKILPPEEQKMAEAVGYKTNSVDAIAAETSSVHESFEEVRKARNSAGKLPLGNIPVIVLTHKEDRVLPAGEEKEYEVWVQLHKEIAAESSRGRQVVVEKSGHFIAIDQPARVVEAIGEILRESREEKSP